MTGLWIAVAITALLSVAMVGGVLFWRSPRAEQGFLALLIALTLPMSPLVFYGVRRPADDWLKPKLNKNWGVPYYRWLSASYAPLTEEPAKLWPLLLPWIARRIVRENVVRAGVALGLGFGLGEIGLVANFARADATVAALPWHQLGGFINERFMVCVMHGAFTATALYGWKRWRWGILLGPATAMALHFLGNLPLFLAKLRWFGTNTNAVRTGLGIWVAFYFLAMIALLARLATGGFKVGQFIFGDATCPDCGVTYPRPLFGVNLGMKRLERCPHCKKWHKL